MDLDLNDELGLDDLEPWDAPLGGDDGDFDDDFDLHGESPGDSDAEVDLIGDYEGHAADGDVGEVGPPVGDGGSCADTDRQRSSTGEAPINLDPLASTTNVVDTDGTLNITSPGKSSSPPKDIGPLLRLPTFWVVMTFSGFLGLAISFMSMWFLHQTGATTYSLVGSLNKIPLSVAGILLFKVPTSLENSASIFFADTRRSWTEAAESPVDNYRRIEIKGENANTLYRQRINSMEENSGTWF